MTLSRPVRTALDVLLYIFIVGGIVLGIPKGLSYSLGTQYPLAAITSGSMWPALKEGDLVLIRAVPKEDLRVGDIIVWQNPEGFTIHRVSTLGEKMLTTKGDANFKQDKPIYYDDVVGRTLLWNDKPVRIPYLGRLSMFASKYKNTTSEETNTL